jgi:signal transduction histidine kinase/CheY-like chemotaxis protein
MDEHVASVPGFRPPSRKAGEDRGARLLGSLDRLLTAMIESEDLTSFLDAMLGSLSTAVDADRAVLRLWEEGRMVSRARIGMDAEVAARGDGAGPPDPPSGLSTQIDLTFLVPHDLANDPESECLWSSRARRGCRVPLATTGDLVGHVYLGRTRDLPFTDEDRALLAELAPRAAAAILRREALDRLQRGLQARDEMLAVVAHDLRNPLNVIAVAANVLLQRQGDPALRRHAERILRGAQRADRLIRDLLESNAIESGRFSIEMQSVEPADLVLSALDTQQSLAQDASVIIATDISPDLPRIDADEERLHEVLENLIGNAIKFTAAGGSITVAATSSGDDVVFSVRDSGSGIAAEHLPRIFDRFWHARASRSGTGLGLSICKAIVEAHGGRIWAESEIGIGSTVSFALPARRESVAARPEVVSILLVDDRPDNLLSLKTILDRPDYHLVTATSGEEALRLALREDFAVALVDVAMPGMNGLEVALHLKELERTRDIPIIFITAFGDDPQEIHRAYAAGGADYLVKPLDAEIVRKKVGVFVHLGRIREDASQRASHCARSRG